MGIVTYFGKNYGAPIYLESHPVPTPVGMPCRYCDELIREGEDGFRDGGNSNFHRECLLRMIFGSVAHQARTCSCYGRLDETGRTTHLESCPCTEGYPEEACECSCNGEKGMTKREGARAALAYRETHR